MGLIAIECFGRMLPMGRREGTQGTHLVNHCFHAFFNRMPGHVVTSKSSGDDCVGIVEI